MKKNLRLWLAIICIPLLIVGGALVGMFYLPVEIIQDIAKH